MAAILADNIFNCISLNENDRIPIQISLKYVLRSPIDNKPALVQAVASCLFSTNVDPINWRIYAALGRDELKVLKYIMALSV